ncbi:cytochrome p450 1a1 [Fusarium flagelliforme]|uniref:Cytochrome p450 1a1 n=1 Tax=Fusarium flagelliforme TaxID=2675880 RepID=A0A395N4M1_9HYPO|nr:cytochrome p450 1a1 [Fusarium flagelliforme]
MLSFLIDSYQQVSKSFPITLLLSIITTLYLLRRALLPKPIPGIPYNKNATNSIFGDLLEFRSAKSRHTWWALQAVKHQYPLVQIFMKPFGLPWVFVADHFEASDICMRRLKEFDRGEVTRQQFDALAPGHQISLKTSDPRFKKNRELVRDLMSTSFLQQTAAPQIHHKFEKLMELWDRKTQLSGGRPFDIAHDIQEAVFDIILGASFGVDSGAGQIGKELDELKAKTTSGGQDDAFEFEPVALYDEDLSSMGTLIESFNVCIRFPWPIVAHFIYRNISSKMRKATAMRIQLQEREIAKSIERKENGHAQRCALDSMMEREDAIAEKEGRKPNYRNQSIISELLGYLVAGHETTSAVVKWGMKYLTKDQRVQLRLREALREAHPEAIAQKRIPTMDEILKAHIPYLDAVIEETLRNARVAPVTLREAVMDTQILGHHIPKGTTIAFLGNGPGVMMPSIPLDPAKRSEASRAHMDRIHQFGESDIEQFVPERWLSTDEQGETVFDASQGPQQAFGLGPRACFGKKLVFMELKAFFTFVFWNFKLESVKDELATEEEMLALTRAPKNVYVKLTKVECCG